ncbi:MAG: prepilin-type N-terminal cleavage/methylation domain-containing protein [Chthoniobacterales bacterium]|nr:prepilin-type N-terminal cleavage/methylation domain-containing protein [Chthoniobacterales bacterium]
MTGKLIINGTGDLGKSRCPAYSAFTLTELLVVIAVLLILAALLFPAASSFLATAKSVRCVNNLRQVGLALLRYANDHDGIIYFHYNSASGTTRWSDCLTGKAGGIMAGDNYLGNNASVMVCPSAPPYSYKDPLTGFVYGCLPSVYPNIGVSDPSDTAAFNWVKGTFSRAVRLSAIEKPSQYWFLADNWSPRHSKQLYIIYDTMNIHAHLRHNGKANVLFADAHVESLGKDGLSNLSPNPLHKAYDENNQLVEF